MIKKEFTEIHHTKKNGAVAVTAFTPLLRQHHDIMKQFRLYS